MQKLYIVLFFFKVLCEQLLKLKYTLETDIIITLIFSRLYENNMFNIFIIVL